MDERKRESAKKIEKRKKEIAEWERERKKKYNNYTRCYNTILKVRRYCSHNVKNFTSNKPNGELVWCINAKIPLHVPFAITNTNTLMHTPQTKKSGMHRV